MGSVGGTPIPYGCREQLTGQPLLEHAAFLSTAQFLEARFVTCVPRDVRTDFGSPLVAPAPLMCHSDANVVAVASLCWRTMRSMCEQISGCTIDERPLNKFRSNMPSNSDWQGQAKSTSVPHSDSPVSYRIRTCRTDVLLAVRSPTCCRTVMKYYC